MVPKRRYRPDPAAWLPRVVSRDTAAGSGLSHQALDRRLAAGLWVRLAPGVYCTAPPATDDDLLHAAVLHGGVTGCVSGTAGLVAYGFRSVATWERALVLVPYETGPRSIGRIQVRPTPHLPVGRTVAGLRLAPVARCVVDHCIGERHVDHVRAVVAEAVQRGRCSPPELEQELAIAPMRGSRHVRTAIADVGAGARSAPEARAAAVFRRVELPTWTVNHPFRIGARSYVFDFWFDELRASVEVDGEEYHRFGAAWDRTLARDAEVQTAGVAVLHVQPSLTRSADGLLARVVPWLRRRASDRGIPWRWNS